MEPHPVLTAHYRVKEEKPQFLRRAFDQAAPFYERLIRWGFFGSGDRYRQSALERHGLRSGMRLLDVAAGTGTTARAAVRLLAGGVKPLCLDVSFGMLRESQTLVDAHHVQGEADRLPLRDETFDFLSMGFALRHVEDLEVAFREYRRVLAPGGRVCLLDMTPPTNRGARWLAKLYFAHLLPRLVRVVTGRPAAAAIMRYYWDTVDHMVPPAQVLAALEQAGFRDAKRHVVLGMFSEYTATKR